MPKSFTSRYNDPRLAKAAELIKSNGYASVNAALRAVDLDRTTYTRAIRDGLSANPRTMTISKLRALGVLSMVKRAV